MTDIRGIAGCDMAFRPFFLEMQELMSLSGIHVDSLRAQPDDEFFVEEE